MIVTKTPFRITLGGGGTDLPAFADRFGGFVVAVTINKYMYIVLNEPFDDLVRLKYSKSESVDSIDKLEHSLAREALRLAGVTKKIDVVSLSDIPAGTGLGSSGAYLVGLLKALYAYKRCIAPAYSVGNDAYAIEAKILGHPVGYQDQFAAALGGFSVLSNEPKDPNVQTGRVDITFKTMQELNRNLLIFYTFTRHDSNQILSEEKKQIESGDAVRYLKEIKVLGHGMLDAIEYGDLDTVGYIMDEHWKLKRSISKMMSNAAFDEIYDQAKLAGALGGKVGGSGGGGFFIFYVKDNHSEFISRMEKLGLQHMPYIFEVEGSKVIVNI